MKQILIAEKSKNKRDDEILQGSIILKDEIKDKVYNIRGIHRKPK